MRVLLSVKCDMCVWPHQSFHSCFYHIFLPQILHSIFNILLFSFLLLLFPCFKSCLIPRIFFEFCFFIFFFFSIPQGVILFVLYFNRRVWYSTNSTSGHFSLF
uniref:Uncharacterized protein n=1 Tax=Cacopsylla melanoneura TaxID=428564 RepID=A0A8D8U154_9HEMI